MFKKTIVILAIVICALVLFLAVLGFFKDQIIKGIVNSASSHIIGARINIQKLSMGVLNQSIRIEGFKMYNPKGFPQGLILDMPRIVVDYDLGALLKGKVHLFNVVVDLKEVGIVKNEDGKLNVDSLAITQKKEADIKDKPAGQPKSVPFSIDSLDLKIGRLVYKELVSGKEPMVQVYNINLEKKYKNIKSAHELALLILSEPMKAAGIKGAAIYGIAAFAGVGVLPVVAAVTLTGKDSAVQEFNVAFDKVFQESLEVLRKEGTIKKEDKASGTITISADFVEIAVKIRGIDGKKTQVSVSARKYLLPKPEIAGGILYKIAERLK